MQFDLDQLEPNQIDPDQVSGVNAALKWLNWNEISIIDHFILFNIFVRKNKISKVLISVGIHCRQGKSVINDENEQSCRAVIKYFLRRDVPKGN